MATIVEKSLVPEHAKPAACARLRCKMVIRHPDWRADDPGVAAFFVHQDPDGSVDEYAIPMAWLDDPDKDLWAEVQPWMARLHEQGEAPTSM